MDLRPPPPITIEGGPGWTMDPTSGETIAAEPDDEAPDRPGRRRQVTALLLAAALGFGAATLLAERRQSVLDASPDGVLSVEAGEGTQLSTDLVGLDGGLAVQASVVLRNTGPREIELEAVDLPGTEFAADDVAGRRIDAGRSSPVRLLRPIRCDDLEPLGVVGPLRVRALTGAGTRTTQVRADVQSFAFTAGFARAACGMAGPGQSLVVTDTAAPEVAADRAQVSFALSNASAQPLLVQSVALPPGLRLAALQTADGTDVALPLRLPAGDYDPPTDPMLGRGEAQRLVAVLEISDCALVPPRGADDLYLPLFQAGITDERGRSDGGGAVDDYYGGYGPGGSAWGDPSVVERLRAASCPARESALTTVPPGRP